MTEPKYGDALPTKRQREIFDFIEAYQRENGVTPSLRKIATHIGVHSRGTVRKHLERMKDQGVLQREKNSKSFKISEQFSKGVYVKVVNA
jgi:SOS-response transcriptional repressor LexA